MKLFYSKNLTTHTNNKLMLLYGHDIENAFQYYKQVVNI